MTTRVRIENTYSDGHNSTHAVELPTPARDQDLEEWFADEVWLHTGDGHGEDDDLGFYYDAEVIASDRTDLVGETYDWLG